MSSAEDRQTSRWARAALWGLKLLLAAAFLSAGSFKVIGHPMMIDIFDRIGAGQGFRLLTGILEVIGGAGVLLPALAPFAAVLIACTMLGAVVTHVFVIGGSALPAVVLLAIALVVACAGREQISAFMGRLGFGEAGRDASPPASAGEP